MLELFKGIFSKNNNTTIQDLIKDDAFLVDVRSQGEFAEGHVKKSVNIPLDQIQKQLKQFKDKKHIIVFCRSGMRSSQAKAVLERNGFTNVTNGGTWKSINSIINK